MEEHKGVAHTPEPEEAKRALGLALVAHIPNHPHGMKHEVNPYPDQQPNRRGAYGRSTFKSSLKRAKLVGNPDLLYNPNTPQIE